MGTSSTPPIFTDGPELLTITEAAEGLGIHRRTVHEAVVREQKNPGTGLPAFIPFGKEPGRTGPGQGYRIKREDLHRWYFGDGSMPPGGYKSKASKP